MRAVWIDAGNDADPDKLRRYEIDSCYLDLRDPRVTLPYLGKLRTQGFAPGLYFADSWWPGLTGEQLAEKVSGALTLIAPRTPPTFPMLCADLEAHDVPWLLAFWRRWRELRPKRRTDWTLEGFQGGLFDASQVAQLVAYVIGEGAPGFVVPQNYTGTMAPLAADRVALDLVSAGFAGATLKGFYDAAALPERWDGYAFTQGRLP